MAARRGWLLVLALATVVAALAVGLAGLLPAARDSAAPAPRLLVGDSATYAWNETDPDAASVGWLNVSVPGIEQVRGNDSDWHLAIRTEWSLVEGEADSHNLTAWLDPASGMAVAVAQRTDHLSTFSGQPGPALLFPTGVNLTAERLSFPDGVSYCIVHAAASCRLSPFTDHAVLAAGPIYPADLVGSNATGSVRLHRLAWTPGDRLPPILDEVPQRDPAPALQEAALQPWGLDETGTAMPYPPSEAYHAAVQNLTATWFQDWLRANPQHVAVTVGSSSGFNINDEWRAVDLRLLSPTSLIGIKVERHNLWTWPITSGAPLDKAPLSYDLTALPTPPELAAKLPTWEDLPQSGPTWASLEARWRALAIPAAQDKPFTTPALRWSCQAACTPSDLVALAGHSSINSEVPTSSGSIHVETSQLWSYLSMDGTGRLRLLDEGTDQQSELQLGAGLPEDSGPHARSATQPQPVWDWPAPAVVEGASLLALLAATAMAVALKVAPLAGFSRIPTSQLEESPVRARILEAVRAQPGVHFQALVRGLGLSNGSAVHHLHKLVGAGLLAEERRPGATCYFLPNQGLALRGAAPVLRSAPARRVLEQIVAHPGQALREVGRSVGLGAAATHHHVDRLAQAGLVEKHHEAARLRLRATSLGEDAVKA